MADQVNSLEELSAVSGDAAPATAVVAEPREPVRDALGRAYATGKRKDAVARVWIKPGSGKVVVNGKELNTYFARPVLQMILRQPFQVAGVEDQFIGTRGEFARGQDVFIRASVIIGHKGSKVPAILTLDHKKLNLEALCRATARSVQNMCCQIAAHRAAPFLASRLVPESHKIRKAAQTKGSFAYFLKTNLIALLYR